MATDEFKRAIAKITRLDHKNEEKRFREQVMSWKKSNTQDTLIKGSRKD